MNSLTLKFLLSYLILNIIIEVKDYHTIPEGSFETQASLKSAGFLGVPGIKVIHNNKTYKYYDISWSNYIVLESKSNVRFRYQYDSEKDKITNGRLMDYWYKSLTISKLMMHAFLLFVGAQFIRTHLYFKAQKTNKQE